MHAEANIASYAEPCDNAATGGHDTRSGHLTVSAPCTADQVEEFLIPASPASITPPNMPALALIIYGLLPG